MSRVVRYREFSWQISIPTKRVERSAHRRYSVPKVELIKNAASQSPVKPPERMGKHERHNQDARSENEHVLGLTQIEVADTTDEQVGNPKIEQAP